MPKSSENIQLLLSELIQKQMVILGPAIALDRARKVSGLEVGQDGTVIKIFADPHLVLKGVINEYITLTPAVARLALDALATKYPLLTTF
jgi:hypothetical protein